MEEKKEKPFSAPRWNEYQSVKPLKIYVKPTEETKKKVEDFRQFINKKIEQEEDTKKEN